MINDVEKLRFSQNVMSFIWAQVIQHIFFHRILIIPNMCKTAMEGLLLNYYFFHIQRNIYGTGLRSKEMEHVLSV